jgi:LCP family protein required for cell wall assembly
MSDSNNTLRKRHPEKKPRHRHIWAWLLSGILAVGAGGGAWAYQSLNPTTALATPRVKVLNHRYTIKNHHITVLLLGNALSIINNHDVTNPYVRDRTDAMMLISLDTETGSVHVLSIPRDSLVDIPHVGYTKLNEANYFGGPKLAVQEVENMLHVPVDYYLETTMWNFADIINQIGGLTLYVPKPMHYGGTGNFLDINLNQGWQHLNGQQVLEFARFRHEPMGSIARSFQQQAIIKAIMHKLLQPQYLVKLPEIALELRKDIVYTNLQDTQLVSLALLARHVSLSHVAVATIPGTPTQRIDPYMHIKLDYWVDNAKWEKLLADSMVGKAWTAAQRKTIHFVVRSGTETLTAANQVASWLTHQGYTVNSVIWANRHNHQHNTILNFTGDESFAQQLADNLGTSTSTTITNSPYHDVTHLDMIITVGSDYHPSSAIAQITHNDT